MGASIRTSTPNEDDLTGYDYSHFVFPEHPQSLAKVLASSAAECRHMMNCIDRFAASFRCAIDVGASAGCMTHALAQRYASVVAFEPWPDASDCFKMNLFNNEPERCDIQVIEKAAGAEHIIGATMYSAHRSRRDAHLEGGSKGPRGDEILVRVVPLDDIPGADRPVDFIKLDTEGTEIDVLKGAAQMIDRWRPLIYMEIKSSLLPKSAEFMRSIRYKQLACAGHNYLFGDKF